MFTRSFIRAGVVALLVVLVLAASYAVWRNITAPTLWIAAAESDIPKWLDEHPEGEGATDSFAGIRRRFAHIPHGQMVTIADAGHMLHHDQPAAVAAAMESFLIE